MPNPVAGYPPTEASCNTNAKRALAFPKERIRASTATEKIGTELFLSVQVRNESYA